MPSVLVETPIMRGRSREGAWIEIVDRIHSQTAWRRSREGAWIEMPLWARLSPAVRVAPVRERGLK